jgi:valyl-tRNA synthetase
MDKQYNHQAAEQETQLKWHKEKTYSMANNPGPIFSIDTPPPTVSGNLHIGHIFSYTQTDILARYARMNGKSVFYPFGFDDNGLPTERYVEKKLDIRAHTMSRSEFIKICLQETHAIEEQFQQLWQRIGLSVDWNYCYSTISDSTRKISQESFLRLLEKGFVYRKNEPALYCPTDRTSVAQAELDDVEKSSFFNDIIFKDAQGNDLIIGTTRPELLPSVNALFYNPNDKRYQHLAGTHATVALFNQNVPILADEKVLIDKGTGLVMSSTFGDTTDIEWFKKHNLEYRPMIGLDGKMLPEAGILAGLTVSVARTKIIEELKLAGLLVNQKPIVHTVNVHERCKKEIEYVMIPQWFLNLIDHKKEFLALADRISWYPQHMKFRYTNWVENIGWDWCLSRQRFYGIPFPVWHCKKCNEILPAKINQLPIDPQETAYSGKCPKCGSSEITPDTDVMDTWNTSSLTPYLCFALFNPKAKSVFSDVAEFIPMTMRPQAHDIIRTWAFYTIVKAWMHDHDLPWHTIVISGHVLAESKEKLSKSKENAPTSPHMLLERYPADVIRYWTASGGLGHDIAFSESQLKIGQRLVTKIWNAFRFIHEHSSIVPQAQPSTPLGVTNEWLLHTATQTFAQYQKYFDDNEFGLALDVIEKFFWHNFCDNYLELIKDQLFKPDNYTEVELKATRWTLYHVGLRILQMYAPYLPHITEKIYEIIYEKQTCPPELAEPEGPDKRRLGRSIHQLRFSAVQQGYMFEESAKIMHVIIELITQVRKLKTEKQLSLKVPLSALTITATDQHLLHKIEGHTQLIRGITHAQVLHFKAGEFENMLEQKDDQWIATVGLK